MGRTLLSLYVGAVAEIFVFLSLIPGDSMKQPTPWQIAMRQTLFPMVLVKDVLGSVVDALPQPFSAIGSFLILGFEFLVQAALFGLPVWIGMLCLSRLPGGNRVTVE